MVSSPLQKVAPDTNAAGINAKRRRVMHKYWLDVNKAGEAWLDRQVQALKRERRYASTIRDGLRLILDLRAGRTDILFEMFPNLIDKIVLDAMLARGVQMPENNVQIAEPPRLGKVIPLPESNVQMREDDVQITIKKADPAESKASQNFLSSAFALQ